MSHKNGVLLINLGTPRNPEPLAVEKYLKEFLMDPLVIDIPYVFRWILVNWLIVPKRKFRSAEAYEKIWTDGSPLLNNSIALLEKLQRKLGVHIPCKLGMRYGRPRIISALRELRTAGVSRLIVVPLYPQYALSSTESSIREVKRVLRKLNWNITPLVIRDFFDRDEFINPLADKIEHQLHLNQLDKIVFSFHGLPARHVKKLDSSGKCYRDKNCCDRVSKDNRLCYRAQSFATARKLAARLGISYEKYIVSFQSRLGAREWIKPYTDIEIPKLIAQGAQKVAVVCPSFVADCLETLEEIDIRARADFIKAGGELFAYVGCLNDDDRWVEGLSSMILRT